MLGMGTGTINTGDASLGMGIIDRPCAALYTQHPRVSTLPKNVTDWSISLR
jgi:hypothetical protein